MKKQYRKLMNPIFVIISLAILGTIALSLGQVSAQMPPPMNMPPNGIHPGEKMPSQNMSSRIQDKDVTSNNIGQGVSDFVKYAFLQFQDQRTMTLDAIKKCRENLANADEMERDLVRQECRLELDKIKNSFSDVRQTFRDTFSEFRSSMRVMVMDERGYDVSSVQRQNAMNMINERAQNMNVQERTSIGNLYDRIQHRMAPTSNFDQCMAMGNPASESSPRTCTDAAGNVYTEGENPRPRGPPGNIATQTPPQIQRPSSISNFDQCMAMGNPASESSPRTCTDAAGNVYTEGENHTTNNSSWNPQLEISEQDGFLLVKSNGIPNHEVGNFPNRYNPNTIEEQNYEFKIPLNPQLSGHMTELPMGPIGISLDGAPFFNPYTAQHTDAVVNEVFDDCSGHPTERGAYHYHQLPSCFKDTTSGHSALFGYAFDGFPVYGFNGEDGVPPTDLDECNGHVEENLGYHYHATKDFPYLLGCYSGQPEPGDFRR